MSFTTRLAFCLLAFWTLAVRAEGPSIEGIFEGTMHLLDEEERDIPLMINLALTGEIRPIKDGDDLFDEQRVIEGAFVVDEEGGPYAFSEVKYTLEKNQIDIRYNRPENNLKPNVPVSFRLLGTLGLDDTIEGKVISGVRGPIGTFKVQKTNRRSLVTKTKYIGEWEGTTIRDRDGEVDVSLVINRAGGTPATNPQNLEFEYTPGKMGNLYFKVSTLPFNTVVVDYLRRRVYLSDVTSGSRSTLSYEGAIDFINGTFIGFGSGIHSRTTRELKLKKRVPKPTVK